MIGERAQSRLTVRRADYVVALVLVAVVGGAFIAWVAFVPKLAPLAVIVVAGALATVIGCIRALSGPRSFAISADAVVGDAEGLQARFAAGLVIRRNNERLRGLGEADGKHWLWVPGWVTGDKAHFTTAVLAGIQHAMPMAYATTDARLSERGLQLPAALEEVRQRIRSGGGEPGLVFTAKPPATRWSWWRWFLIGLLVLAPLGIVIGVPAVVPFLSSAIGFAIFFLVLSLVAQRRGKGLWLFIHDDGLALIRPDLSGEMAWSEVAEIAGVKPGFLAPKRTDGQIGALARLRTVDQADILLVDVFDAPLACIVEAMRVRRNRASAPLSKPADGLGPPAVISPAHEPLTGREATT